MKISAKIDYACRALLELSLHWPSNTPLQINTIAQRQQIPTKFLTQILLTLKQLGYVNSSRGKNGGYLLAQAPKDIKLSQIVKGFGGLGFTMNETKQNQQFEHVMDSVWQDIDEAVSKTMSDVNFEIIRQRARSQEHVMMFGI